MWHCGTYRFDLRQRPLIMGIVNATPDSFSDRYPEPALAVEHGLALLEQGADILDVGGESTRPGSDPVDLEEEWARVRPVIEALVDKAPVSLDTRRPEVARRGLALGVSIINHVSATLNFEQMLPVLAENGAGYIAMHMLCAPKTMQKQPCYRDVVTEIGDSLEAVGQCARSLGISAERILFDPGIGFGKTLDHNLTLMAHLPELVARLRRPCLIGLSRKSWLTHLVGNNLSSVGARDALTATASGLLPFPEVAVHRVHNVALVAASLKVKMALIAVHSGKAAGAR